MHDPRSRRSQSAFIVLCGILLLIYQNCGSKLPRATPVFSTSNQGANTSPFVSPSSVPSPSPGPRVGTIDPACQSSAVKTYAQDYLNLDLNDYGLIFFDARDFHCSLTAAQVLQMKVASSLKGLGQNPTSTQHQNDPVGGMVGPFQGWLEGAQVEMIFVSALELGGQNALTPDLDSVLQKVRDIYQFNKDKGCGLTGSSFGNNCMDDYSQAAAGYAWIAAYEKMSGRSFSTYAMMSHQAQSASLNTTESVCLYKPTMPGTCAGSFAELVGGTALVASFNHGYENIGYGLGLMTSLSSAAIGLELAGDPFKPTDMEKTIALAVFEEGQRKASPGGDQFKTNCYAADGSTTADCGDSGLHYLPKMFAVKPFYMNYFGKPKTTVTDLGVAQAAYQYDVFDETLFSGAFQGPGRRAVYGDLGYKWQDPVQRPPLAGLP